MKLPRCEGARADQQGRPDHDSRPDRALTSSTSAPCFASSAILIPTKPGWSFTINSGKHYIRVNGKDSDERQNFTACHEIAHIVLGLPSDHKELPWWSYAKRSPNEIACDVFAAELLLPYKLFKPLVDKSDISLSAVDGLAQDFVASAMATGSRFAALVRAPCAFVLSEQGKVRYASRSTALRDANAWI